MRCLIASPVSTPVRSLGQVATIAIWAKGLFERKPLDEVVYVVDLDDALKLPARMAKNTRYAEWRLDAHRITVAELLRALKEQSCVPENNVPEHKKAENKQCGEGTVQLRARNVSRFSRRRVKYYRRADKPLFDETRWCAQGVEYPSSGLCENAHGVDCTGDAQFPFTVKGEKVLVLEKSLRKGRMRQKTLRRIALELAEWHQAQWEESCLAVFGQSQPDNPGLLSLNPAATGRLDTREIP
ncbi:hypothetical protein GNI_058320 [Gregarina niphandrodes]|uniref:Uncharacterized protein n=1 Tax=Gregarina niphandrodes TaxID=110365 RepID=A0A023B8Q9_GRENI|nr:hypothetical protein GNI_058320 [Gregarina niphandrodes]EZG69382.1 hypothetical protein GNI_058320 [Gregarina niphandrodes]|eukprot:XP_011134440.1 hypothetical protein GNI_058320 [Gregarina niphandrodes]